MEEFVPDDKGWEGSFLAWLLKGQVSSDKWVNNLYLRKVFPFSKDASLHSLKRSEPSTCGQAYPLIWRRIYPIFLSPSVFIFIIIIIIIVVVIFSFLKIYKLLKSWNHGGGFCFFGIAGGHGSVWYYVHLFHPFTISQCNQFCPNIFFFFVWRDVWSGN